MNPKHIIATAIIGLCTTMELNAGVSIRSLIGQNIEKTLLDEFVGSGIEISNATFNGEAIIPYGEGTQIATFKNNSECGMLGIAEGVMLSTNNTGKVVSNNTDFLFADSNLSAKEINEYVNGYYKAKIQDRLTTDKKYINYYLSYGVPEIYDEEFFPYSEEEYNTLKELKDDPSFIEAVSYYSIMGNDVLYKIEDNKKYSIYAVYDKIHSWEPKYYDASATEVEEVRNMSQEFDYHDEYIYHFVNTEPIKYDKEKEDLYSRLYKTISYTTKQNHRSEKELEGLTGTEIKSPSVLEFDFSTIDDSIAFNYVFASQEYPMFVNSQFNDAFAFIITDLTTGKKENIAKIPGSNTYVSINNVNKEKNSEYFVANYIFKETTYSWENYYEPIYKECNLTDFGGFTTTLTAKTKVVPCRKYHLKLAIGNAVDDDYQSIVFLEAGSFKSNGLSSKIRYTNSRASGIAKDCSNGEIVIHIKDSDTPTKINLKCIGEAKNGIDYKKIPEEIVIPAHQDTAVIELEPIRAIDKDSMEVQIAITIDNSCSNTQEDTVRTYIYKVVPITIKPNIPECCASVLSVEPQGPIKTITWEPADQLEKNEGTTVTPLQCPDIAETFTITAEDKTGCQQVQETLELNSCANEIEMKAELVTENGSSELITGCNTGKLVFHIKRSKEGKDDVKIILTTAAGSNTIEGLPKEITIAANETTYEVAIEAKKGNEPYQQTINLTASCETCVSSPDTIEITTTQPDPIKLGQDNTYNDCKPGGMEVEVPLLSGILGEVVWAPTENLQNTDSLKATLTDDLDSSIVLTVKATDITGCTTDSSVVHILKKRCYNLIIPPFFTPDKDGINENWTIYGLEESEKSKVKVYDRWGKQLIEFNPNTEGWDGTYNGHPCPSSDYWYVVDCEEIDKIYTGHFTLIRE